MMLRLRGGQRCPPRDFIPQPSQTGLAADPLLQKLSSKLFHVNHTDTQPFLNEN